MGIRIYKPSEDERDKVDALRDQAMRFMELVELGGIKSVEDAVEYFGDRAAAYSYIMRAQRWVMGADGAMDQQATIMREEQRQKAKRLKQQQKQHPKGGDQDTERDH